MKGKVLVFILLCVSRSVCSQGLQPVGREIGKLHLSVDPRIELLNTVQMLSNYPLIDRSSSYAEEVHTYFSSFSSQPAVAFTDTLYNEFGFCYDAPVAFMLHLSQVPELRLERSAPELSYISRRAGGKENVLVYRNLLERFAIDSDFTKFWQEQKGFYEQVLDTTLADMQRQDWVEVLEKYYNESQHSYRIVLSPLLGNKNYGPRVTLPDGGQDVYSVNGVTKSKDGIPYLSNNQLTSLVWHEFSHSFVNPNSAKHMDQVMSYHSLFEPIQEIMQRQAYGDWVTCVNEHIVRAVVIRLKEINVDKETAASGLRWEEANGKFVYIKPLLEKLKEFEARRDQEGITFSAYYSELLDAFKGVEPYDYSFSGPVDGVFSTSLKYALIHPTSIADRAEQSEVQAYVTGISQFIQSNLPHEEVKVMADTTALSTSLSDYAILAYGTLESNLFLSHYRSLFPFTVEDGKLNADKEYEEPNLKMISCLPNPQNPKRGMTIYTALSNQHIIGINNVFHGPEDYVIFTDKSTLLKRGYYTKEGKWKF